MSEPLTEGEVAAVRAPGEVGELLGAMDATSLISTYPWPTTFAMRLLEELQRLRSLSAPAEEPYGWVFNLKDGGYGYFYTCHADAREAAYSFPERPELIPVYRHARAPSPPSAEGELLYYAKGLYHEVSNLLGSAKINEAGEYVVDDVRDLQIEHARCSGLAQLSARTGGE